MKSDIKIGTKLVRSMVVVVTISFVMGLAAFTSVGNIRKSMLHIQNVATRKRMLARELSATASNMLAQERGIVLASVLQQSAAVQRSKDDFQDSINSADDSFKTLETVLETDDDRIAVSQLKNQFLAVERVHRDLLQDVDKQQFDKVQKEFDEGVLPKLLTITSEAHRLVQVESERVANVIKEADTRGEVAAWAMLALVVILLGASVPVIFLVRRINARLRAIASEIAEGSEQVASAATEVSSASQSLAQGASEQAASLEETAASSEEVTSMTQKNAEHSRQAAELMAHVDACVAEANRTLREMVTSMHDITDSSNRISKIIKVIDEIAFQTNILALNAAVEAARAGEAGMGFAVVADEVRNLAQRCAQAAKDTAALIEESIAKSGGGGAKLAQMEKAIHAITQSAAKVRTLVDEVSLGSQEQARGTEHIAKSLSSMEAMTQKTAANAEESASASEELSAQAETMKVLVRELRAMVDGNEDFAAKPDAFRSALYAPRPEHATSNKSRPTLEAAIATGHKRKMNGVPPLPLRSANSFPMDEQFSDF